MEFLASPNHFATLQHPPSSIVFTGLAATTSECPCHTFDQVRRRTLVSVIMCSQSRSSAGGGRWPLRRLIWRLRSMGKAAQGRATLCCTSHLLSRSAGFGCHHSRRRVWQLVLVLGQEGCTCRVGHPLRAQAQGIRRRAWRTWHHTLAQQAFGHLRRRFLSHLPLSNFKQRS